MPLIPTYSTMFLWCLKHIFCIVNRKTEIIEFDLDVCLFCSIRYLSVQTWMFSYSFRKSVDFGDTGLEKKISQNKVWTLIFISHILFHCNWYHIFIVQMTPFLNPALNMVHFNNIVHIYSIRYIVNISAILYIFVHIDIIVHVMDN